jgi:hypothetical protein
MSLWQISAAAIGFARAHGQKIEEVLSDAEVASFAEDLNRPPIWER